MHKIKKTGKIGIFITIIILILIVILTNLNSELFSKTENIFSKLVRPIQNGLTSLKNKISNNTSFFDNVENLQSENEYLKTENSKLEEKLRELEIIKAENDTLREYVNMSDKYSDYKTIPAYIIDKNVSNLSDTLIINVGTNNGIKENMAVISSEGLVGHIISATENTAKVKPIIDSSSSVSAIFSSSKDTTMVKGTLKNYNTLKGTYISTETKLVLGDTIKTSGIGGIYPKGILIGTVSQIKETSNIVDRYVIINTAVNFSKLETVLVIVK